MWTKAVCLTRSNGPVCQQQVVRAYLQILVALERRCQFRNPALIQQLRERVFIPDTGFVNASKCRWRRQKSGVFGSSQWYDLLEVYGDQHSEAEASQLERYFTFWLDVPTTMTLEELLDALRQLRSGTRLSRWTGHTLEEGPTLPRATYLYHELCRTLRKTPQADLQAFRDEALIYVTGSGCNWLKTSECLWMLPEEVPEGWSTDREELVAHYGPDPLLREVFTERLGVPVSVRFKCDWEAPVAPVTLQGQPLWILDETSLQGRKKLKSRIVATESKTAVEASGDQEVKGEEVEITGTTGTSMPNVPVTLEAPEPAEVATGRGRDGPDMKATTTKNPVKMEAEKGVGVDEHNTAPSPRHLKIDPESEGEDGMSRTPLVESSVQLRGVASDGRQMRREMLEKLASSVKAMKEERQMVSKANQVKHRAEACVDCNPEHDLVKVGHLESPMADDVRIPVWVERSGQKAAMERLQALNPKTGFGAEPVLLHVFGEKYGPVSITP
eukprot:symbB.v1.2.005334.t1/scaffold306.1/size233132/6